MSVIDAAALTRYQAEEFLYDEADLLDAWQLEQWLALCTGDVVYEIPSTTHPQGEAATSLFLVHDDRYMLESRVRRLLSRNAHAENPPSRTRRLISNVRIGTAAGTVGAGPLGEHEVAVRASFHVLRFRNDEVHQYVGRYTYRLRQTDAGLRIAYRRATLDMDSLRPGGGKVSILL
ncbi:MAG: aromatic-ring-hydroxylating dioxygenase subunit beta [Acidimicrobiales bacterium]